MASRKRRPNGRPEAGQVPGFCGWSRCWSFPVIRA